MTTLLQNNNIQHGIENLTQIVIQNNNIQHGIEKLTQIVIQNKNSKFSDGKWELYELCKYSSKGKGKCRHFHWLSCLLRGLATLLINLIFHI